MAGKENVIKAMVLAAKKTLVGFAKKLDDGIIKLVYGVNLPKIENELVGLENVDLKKYWAGDLSAEEYTSITTQLRKNQDKLRKDFVVPLDFCI